ncbi:hypothetical protein [Salegentibacter maritimus]|uniref:hypothetical protein n=1 Tax=Salegentibacter maritimus TaxID=2794347 RepID=UPI0018E45800|nr:hypothetical protein [Salegentibacter maritimus]MBI6117889.1 hypothetical protein [Salegentibacter maritimus]
MNGYEFSRAWFDFSFNHPNKVKPVHTAIYFFAIERCNRLGWKETFGFPTDLAMEALGIKNYKTYIRALEDLVDWEFIKWVQKSKNQYTSNIIALVKNTNAPPKALDRALHKALHTAVSEQCSKQVRSIASINKQLNLKLQNLKTLNKKEFLKVDKSEIPENYLGYFNWAFKFQQLFLKNLKNKGAPTKKVDQAGFEDCLTPIRLMLEKDGVSEEQLQLAYELLNGSEEFWKGIILSTHKLREKIGQLIAQGNKPMRLKTMDLQVQHKIQSYD